MGYEVSRKAREVVLAQVQLLEVLGHVVRKEGVGQSKLNRGIGGVDFLNKIVKAINSPTPEHDDVIKEPSEKSHGKDSFSKFRSNSSLCREKIY